MEDGEGTSKTPLDGSGELAHYYRFEEIVKGRKLVSDGTADNGYAYGGDSISFNANEIWRFPKNSKISDYEIGTDRHAAATYFSTKYTEMLQALQTAYDGQPETMIQSRQKMGEIRTAAVELAQFTDPETGNSVGLCFEYYPQDGIG